MSTTESRDYRPIRSASDSDPESRSLFRLKYLAPIAGGLAAAAFGIVGLLHLTKGSSRVTLVGSGVVLSPGPVLTCSCPPAMVLWPCSREESRAILNGSRCEYYKTQCDQTCSKQDGLSLECRACRQGLTPEAFCGVCTSQGLNDVGCNSCHAEAQPMLLGGDADKHGCRPSAGYHWCKALARCVRAWELKGMEAAQCAPVTEEVVVGGDRDSHGCIPSAGYRWCKALSQCVRPWELKGTEAAQCAPATEEVVVGKGRDSHGCIPSAGYLWCAAMAECIRPWERGLHSEEEVSKACRLVI